MTAGLALLVGALFMAGTATAQVSANDTEDSDVTVSVSETIEVDVQPANLDYSNALVGNRNTTSDRNFGAIEVENTGSVYIDKVWLEQSTPSEQPFGNGSAALYDAGNFMEVKPTGFPNGDDTDWNYINRKEYLVSSDSGSNGVTDVPSYIQTSFSEPYEVGQIRRGNESIFFAIQADSGDDTCNNDGDTLRVGNVSALDNRLGTVDFTDSTEFGWTEYSINALTNSDYGQAGVDLNWTYTESGSDSSYDLLTRCAPASEQPHSFVNKYSVTQGSADDLSADGTHTTYLLDASNADNMLAPGEYDTIKTAINVPEGVAAGNVGAGTLSVKITADTSADTS